MTNSGGAMSPEEAKDRAGQLNGWQFVEGKKLTKSFKFNFVNKITPIAEAQQHHPDLFVSWGEVKVELSTHSAGGLTDADFELAKKIDRA